MGTKFEDLEKNSAKKTDWYWGRCFFAYPGWPGTHGWYGKRHY